MATPYVAVIGASNATDWELSTAQELGRALAEAGCVLVCGGLGGVMNAAAHGAESAGGISIGILPGDERDVASPHLTVAIATGFGEARNAIVARSADAVVAVGGEFGTLSEIALALKMGTPVIGVGTWELGRDDLDRDPIVRVAERRRGRREAPWLPPADAVGSGTVDRPPCRGGGCTSCMSAFLVFLASVWCALSVAFVAGTVQRGGRALAFAGRPLAVTPVSVTIVVVCAVSVTAALALAAALAYARGRRLERRMAAELDDHWAALAEREAADAARTRQLARGVAELQTLVEGLVGERAAGEVRARHLAAVPDGEGDPALNRLIARASIRSRR